MYADDTSMAVTAADPAELELKVDSVVQKFSDWCEQNKIILNLQKTVMINFHVRRPLPDGITNRQLCTSVNFLGVVMDQHLRFDIHVQAVCDKLNKSYFALLKLKECLSEESLLESYYALCYSHLAYCNLVWGLSPEWRRVFVAQKRILRLLFNVDQRTTCRHIFKEKSLLTFPSIYILSAVIFIKTNIEQYASLVKVYPLRNSDLPLLLHKTALFEKSPQYNFVKLYNKLPDKVKNISKLGRFKGAVRDLLVRGAYYNQQDYLLDNLE